MKKFVSVILSICIIMSMSIGVFAADEELFEVNGEFFTAEEIAESEIVFEKYLKKGETALNKVQRDTWASLKVSLLLQTDSRWNDLEFPCNHTTYGESGCAMTSYSMVLNYYGNNTTPVTVAEKYQANYGDCCKFSSDNLLKDYPGRSKDSVTNAEKKSYSQIKTAIVGALADGYPVVVKVDADSEGNYHFVVCYAYVTLTSGKVELYIRDPMGTHTYLDEYYNEGRKPVSVVIVK